MVAVGPAIGGRAASSRWVVAAGVSAGPGVGSRNVALAVRSGWHDVAPLPFAEGTVLGVRSPAIAPGSPRRERLRDLAVGALEDVSARLDLGLLPLVLALPSPVVEDEIGDPVSLAREIGDRSPRLVDPRSVQAFAGDRAVPYALARAFELLEQEKAPAVIVGATDSLVTPEAIADMVSRGRVSPAGWQGGPVNGGVMPGEGAAFVVLSKNAAHRPGAIAELAQVSTEEATPHDVEAPLVVCLERASTGLESIWLLSDVTGEAAQILALGDALRDLKAKRQKDGGLVVRHEPLPGSLGDLGV
ncbi:MAG: hypothetical protein JNK04_22790, partial [Myxococcales bacterium]|nr:hypothetical protein [Myxococcales bacterium]